MPAEVHPGIYRVAAPAPEDYPKDTVNVYVIRGNHCHLIVDAAAPIESSASALFRKLDRLNIDLTSKPIKILLTHTHPDHAGQAETLREKFDATCYLHPNELLMTKLRDFYLSHPEQSLKPWAESHGVDYPLLRQVLVNEQFREIPQESKPIRGGTTLDQGNLEWEILWTPGHSFGHISLYSTQHHILIVGDQIHPDGAPYILKTPWLPSNPYINYLNSIQELSQLQTNIILPGHGEPFHQLQEPIQDIYHDYEQQRADILETIGNDSMTVWEITRFIFDSGKFDALENEKKALSLFRILSHIEALQMKNQIKASFRGGKTLFTVDRNPE